jgi:hypothetical protein
LRPAAAALIAILVAGCSTSIPNSATPVGSAAPPASLSSANATPPARSSAPSGPAASAESDPGLFAIIGGDSGEGLDFRFDADTTASVGSDPGVARDAAGIAIGLFTITGQQPVADFAIVSIVHLRDSAADEAWYRSYRDSYDVAACAQAGGVTGHAESTIDGHRVFIGSCAGGALTYHVRVRDGSLVVSITAVGSKRLGERLVADVDRP